MSYQCICGLPSEFKFPLSSQHFCPRCFSLKFEKKVLNRIPKHIRGHSIAVALSGGKDSTTLLHIFHKYRHKLRIGMLFAIILEEEIPEIQSSRKKIINLLKDDYPNIGFIQKSYSQLFGFSLPYLVQQSDKQGLRFTPCSICGVLRRHGILRMSLDIGVDIIVMGNSLEDEAETVFINLMRGNPLRNFRDQIEYSPADRKSLPFRIKPLAKVTEKSILNYSNINRLPFLSTQCAFAARSLRSVITPFLSAMQKKDPNILYNIVSSIKKVTTINTQYKIVSKCNNCASYSPTPVCSACRIVHQIIN
ncbi:MAG: hypothetical protein ACFFB5_17930 [Promethearchaeota archaeon]